MSPFSAATGTLVLVGVVGVFQGRGSRNAEVQPCNEVRDQGCIADEGTGSTTDASDAGAGGSAPHLSAAEACLNVGYLCADLQESSSIRLRRWKDFSGTIVVYVPRPAFESSADALALQQAAAVGLRAWNGQPFEILTDTRGARESHFSVTWTQSLSGNQIGIARTQWSRPPGCACSPSS